MNETTPMRCILGTDGLVEEDSLAQNVQRAPLHLLDQPVAFTVYPGDARQGRVREALQRHSS